MPSIRVGNAPVSWGVYEANAPNPPFGKVLDAIIAAGYEGTELGPYGYLPATPEALGRELRSRNLGLGSSFLGLVLADPSRREQAVAKALEVARLLSHFGVQELICADDGSPERKKIAGRVPKDGSAGWSDKQWEEAVKTLNAIARALASELKMRVVVHHHAGTFLETPQEIDRLLASTEAELVNLLLDTGHAVYGGADPLDVLQRHGRRVRYVHYKDVHRAELDRVRTTNIHMDDAWKRGVFSPLGQGVVPFPKLTETLRSLGYSGWIIVEQDVVPDASGRLVPDPSESAKQSRRYLRESAGL